MPIIQSLNLELIEGAIEQIAAMCPADRNLYLNITSLNKRGGYLLYNSDKSLMAWVSSTADYTGIAVWLLTREELDSQVILGDKTHCIDSDDGKGQKYNANINSRFAAGLVINWLCNRIRP